ncbi:Xylene monooxygenase electron transfer component [Anaerohalosphaera lusitana]|uniref:Xylene monooxygenase electron transfer component n=1 Tax=Anaerohalosphaera lusitana TaxID=1936003 RepID=A0A1U9NNW2_9BACT|nr:2Fe-2S iron-sulfur cluster binding domain-containing protein [Anaerohalosphaera lusitana]AQT69487.1 Xylene monooxygenase electron transfer component [Anaerohalosphaera lusitana]
MMTVVLSVLAVSSIGAGLALLLVISEKTVGNYGECTIDVNGEEEIKVQGGKSLLSVLTDQKLFVPSACGGRGTCGLCKLKVPEGAGHLMPTELPFLEKDEIENDYRLACQVKVRNNLSILVPKELLSVSEFTAKIAEIKDLTHDIKQFRFELVEPDRIDFTPGQYIQLKTPSYKSGIEEVYRAYSISSDPADKNAVETIVRLVPGGICTTWLFEYIGLDDEITMNGPHGEFHLSDTDAPAIFIAGGSGMAPIKCILHHMKNMDIQRPATYFFGANKVKELFLLDEMKQFEQELANFKFVPVVASPEEDEQWDGETGLVTDAVRRNVSNAAECEAYLCGSPGMIDASVKVLGELGMAEDKIFYDKFA